MLALPEALIELGDVVGSPICSCSPARDSRGLLEGGGGCGELEAEEEV